MLTKEQAQELLLWLQLWRELKQAQSEKTGIKVPLAAYKALGKQIDALIAEAASNGGGPEITGV
jgi:hypothetical protein